ncbi:MAG: hypothetical protein N4A31_03385 [Rickettsiales bacterium]|jgi:hypothetical protein|nr:hypothetical protein [Rickettsiales bacterium]
MQKNINKTIHKHILSFGICVSLVSFSLISQATDGSSMGLVKNVMGSITELIKTEGKLGLQFLSAAAGGLAAAKTVSWQPLLVGAGGAGIVEVLFQAIG